MSLPRNAFLLALIAIAVAVAGCGGGDGDAGLEAPETAAFAPADAAFFASVDTDFDDEQWQNARDLLERFPSGDKITAEIADTLGEEDIDFERDVKPAVGPEVGVVGWDLEDDDPPMVAFTRAKDEAKAKALVAKGDDPGVTRNVDGWLVAAETQADIDRFVKARERGTLADEDAFQGALDSVAGDSAVIAWLNGSAIQAAFDEGIAEEGGPPGLSRRLGRLDGWILTASAEDDGVRSDTFAKTDSDLGLGSYDPALDEAVPAKPLFFFSVANLDDPARKLLDLAKEEVPGFARQLQQAETVLGFSLENDVIALLDDEAAVAVYANDDGDPLPVDVDFVLNVDDEAKARRLMERFGSLLELGENGTARSVTIAGLDATELRFEDENTSVFWAVDDGKLVITSSRPALEALQAQTPRLADDDSYTSALDAAEVPREVAAVMYSDVRTALPYMFDLAEQSGEDIDAEARANTRPLRGAVTYLTTDGNGVHASGFLGIQ